MINLAASEEGIYALPDDFDADPMLLNLANCRSWLPIRRSPMTRP